VLQVPEWHLLHYTIGCSYYKGANDISVGFNYAFGFTTSKRQMINFTQPNHDYFLRGEIKNNMKTIVNSLSLIVGYTYYFKSNPKGAETIQDKMEDW
jgi:hypothetical protein